MLLLPLMNLPQGPSSHPQQQALQQQLAAAAAGVRQMQAEMPGEPSAGALASVERFSNMF